MAEAIWIKPNLEEEKPYSLVLLRFSVRELVAQRPRNFRAIVHTSVRIRSQSMSANSPRPGNGRGQSAPPISPRPCPAQVRGQSRHLDTFRPRMSALIPQCRPRNVPTVIHAMSAFNPVNVRQAVQDFTPPRPPKHQDLISAKDVIIELRQKRASYRSIAELLNQHCLVTSKTAVANFCHEVLGESVRPHRRSARRRQNAVSAQPVSPNGDSSAPPIQATENSARPAPTRGPRIAQVRMIKPHSS